MSSQTNKSAVIVGSGMAGLTTAKLLSQNGFDVSVIEASSKLGGHVSDWSCKATTECQVCYCCSLSDLTAALDELPVKFITNCELDSVIRNEDGSIAWVDILENETKNIRRLPANALVLATGFDTFNPSGKILWGYGTMQGVMTLPELDEIMRHEKLSDIENPGAVTKIAFFQCVGSRDKSIGANYCSQYCCKTALRNAIKIKMDRPNWAVSVFYIDLQLAGKYASSLLENAKRLGIELAQGVPGEINPEDNGKLGVIREKNGLNVREDFDRIILSVGIRPGSSSVRLSEITGVGLDQHGFLQKVSEIDPCRTPAKGVYVAGTCSGPMDIETTALHAAAAASSIIQDLSCCSRV